jgi:single-strand DNA-binding protein
MLNNWVGYGNLTSKPVLKQVGDTQVANFTVACNRSYKPKGSDEFKTEATFVRCEVWDSAATRIAETADKGDAIIVTGELRNNNWEKDGQKFSDTRIKVTRFKVVRRKSDYQTTPQVQNTPEVKNVPDAAAEEIPF